MKMDKPIIPQNQKSQILQTGLQARIGKDQRNKVQDIFEHPYFSIGKLECNFLLQNRQQYNGYGHAGIISKRFIITCAHVIYSTKFNTFYDQIIFHVPYKKNDNIQFHPLKIINVISNRKYIGQNSATRPPLDYAILQLEPNQIIQQTQILKINYDYSFNQFKDSLVNISSYPIFKQNGMLYEQRKAQLQQKQFLYYKHTTDHGNSGGPVLIKMEQSGKYEIIGIHKGNCKINFNYCLLMSSFSKQEKQFIQALIICSFKYPQNWQKVQILSQKSLKQQNQLLMKQLRQKQQKIKQLQRSIRESHISLPAQTYLRSDEFINNPNYSKSQSRYGDLKQQAADYLCNTYDVDIKVGMKFLTHVFIPLNVTEFVKYDWSQICFLGLRSCQIDDKGWAIIVQSARRFLNVRILTVACNKIKTVKKGDLQSFKLLQHVDFTYFENDQQVLPNNPLTQQSKQVIIQFAKNNPYIGVNGRLRQINS